MVSATFAAVLLWRTGVTTWTLGMTVVTCVLTTISVLLFGARSSRVVSRHAVDTHEESSLDGARCLVSAFCFGVLLQGCGSRLQVEVEDIAKKTNPSHDHVLVMSDGPRSGSSVVFSWDLEVSTAPAPYLAWLRAQLAEFSIVDTSPAALRLGALIGGDEYRLVVTAESSQSTNTHVHSELTVSAD